MSTEQPSIIQRLPEELRSAVFSYCDASVVLNLCLTSNAMYHVCIPSLFRTIDLSAHNQDKWGRHNGYINVDVPFDHTRRLLTEQDESILRRQRALIGLLAEQPELAAHTRVLRWTMMDPEYKGKPSRESRNGFNFGTNIAFLTNWRELDPPPPLFSSVTSISLAGVASYAMIDSILNSIDSSKLRHLRLNNLQRFADTDEIVATLPQSESMIHRKNRAGAIYGWLARLTGRCTSLRSFHYFSTAEFVDKSSNTITSSDWLLEVQEEHRRYAELGAFISSVKPTLRELIFEHGPDIAYYGYNPGRHTVRAFEGPFHDNPLPMDAYFDMNVLPVLALGPWPKLEKMVVRGIGHWKPLDPWNEKATREEIRYLHRKTIECRDRSEMIWDAVSGDGVDVCIEAEASRPFYRFQEHKWSDWGHLHGLPSD